MSKFLCFSDLHIRITSPKFRTDNYYETLMEKFEWIVEQAEFYKCSAMLLGGDMFDAPDLPNWAELELMSLCYSTDVPILTVYGQHDLKYRRKEDAKLTVLDEAQAVTLLGPESSVCGDSEIYGQSWDEDNVIPKNPDNFNILVVHRMVTKDGPLWSGHKGFIEGNSLLWNNPDMNLIVSGDNHQSFVIESDGGVLINAGSVMRNSMIQREHIPSVYLFDTETLEITRLIIPHHPFDEVMNVELAGSVKQREEDLEVFMEGLSSDYEVELDYEKNVKSILDTTNVSVSVEDKALEILGRYYER